jgi:hypothetical protein
LWIDLGAWHDKTASASTATAAPSKVVWDMGDGHTLTCDGPGTPYSAADSDAASDARTRGRRRIRTR